METEQIKQLQPKHPSEMDEDEKEIEQKMIKIISMMPKET